MISKANLRKIYKQKRLALDKEERINRMQQMLLHFDDWCKDKSFNLVMSYVSFEKFAEIEMSYFEESLKKKNKQIKFLYPKVIGDQMIAIEPIDNSGFEHSQFGVKEHKEYHETSIDELDLILVPLLIIDQSGQRVGYGKGFYDRFLSQKKNTTISMGLSLFEPIEKIEDVHQGDIPLEFCITPQSLLTFHNN